MRNRRKTHILALVALVLSMLAPAEIELARPPAADGTAVRVNAVHSLCPNLELECQASNLPGSRHALASAGGIDLDEVYYPASCTGARTFSVPSCDPVSLRPVPAAGLALPTDVGACLAEGRGPPLLRVALDPPSLRAPPIA